jgi:hypothetical protein
MTALNCFFDPPEVLDCAVTAIPGSGSSPTQVIAALPFDTARMLICDGIGEFVGIYVGAPGLEALVAIACGGRNYEVEAFLQRGSRISLRSMSTSPITSGNLCVKFYPQG